MNGFSSMTQKGQVAIPKSIRDLFNLKPLDKLYFEVKDNRIIAQRVSSIEEMRGIVNSGKLFAKKDHKKIIRNAVVKKFRKKTSREIKIVS